MEEKDYFQDKNIIITGFMGTGKSAVGRYLADELQRKFVDTDDLIEKETGLIIPKIFERFGEEYFRQIESKIIDRVASGSNVVIAVGGGAIVNQHNFDVLKKNGIIISLTASVDAILSRVSGCGQRALLSKGDKRVIIMDLMKRREPFYNKSDVMIDTTTKAVAEVVRDIKEWIGKTKCANTLQ